ncbi:hypothetical protein NQ315_010395 [Exocentrus adspersus]|uniref:Uncharacterized protein n=1 Tax=Exocentrus adspersus TaxID=1586481 RepID=A0AAV8WB32_9CUCU|nr:hypothetical protein NQ315_010395 [Exocentrus adspersus]
METDYQKMFNNLSQLLHVIRGMGELVHKIFASSCPVIDWDSCQPKIKKIVQSLVVRSKMQLREITKVEKFPENEEYVDMDVNSKGIFTARFLKSF